MSKYTHKIEFEAQIKEVKVRETASNDKETSVRFVCDGTTPLKLQEVIAQDVVKITAEW